MKTFVLTTTALTTFFAFAGEAAAETQTQPFEPTYSDRINEFPWESSYFPAEGALRVKLGASAWQDLEINMAGDAEYAWEGDMFGVRGDADGGDFVSTIGAEITVTIAYDILSFDGEFEIGVYDISEQFQRAFTPYVLDGSGERPVDAAFEIGPFNLVDTPFAVGSGTGTFQLDFRIDSPGISFEGTRVDLSTEQGSTGPNASITSEGEPALLGMPGNPGDRVEIYATEYGMLDSEVSVHLMPTVSLNMFGLDFTIGPFDMEMAYPVLTGQEIMFDEYTMAFDIPETPDEPSDDDGGDGGDDGDEPSDDDGGDDDGDDGDEPEDDDDDEPVDDEPESDGDSVGQVDTVGNDGCGCSADGRGPNTMAFGLMVLGLLALRRRRN
ncbi:MAG: MYXO-CTERM sorting domain-containing protein [Myxococcota bacterium]